ncbi:MAG: hypothetical protein IJ338_07980 [Bacteroidaceae bacterium]|nr:hypothetical protein [Bacteroidaceae bacterium]
MTPFLDKLQRFTTDCVQTALSFVKIILFSKFRTKVPILTSEKNELVIMGNGPSLSDFIEKSPSFWQNKTCLMVNFSACSEQFTIVKPELYVIADPYFWEQQESTERLFGRMVQTVTWPIHLFMPVRSIPYKTWQKMVKENSNIIVHFYNTTPVEGLECITNFLYKRGWGMPRPHNVLIPAIMTGLRMPFQRLYLAGAEHSWLLEVIVDDDNTLYYESIHYYTKQVVRQKTRDSKLYEMMFHMYIVFKGYFRIKDYARYLNKKIYNITPKSYIDAFERIKINSDL